jgi:hypothetical protein
VSPEVSPTVSLAPCKHSLSWSGRRDSNPRPPPWQGSQGRFVYLRRWSPPTVYLPVCLLTEPHRFASVLGTPRDQRGTSHTPRWRIARSSRTTSSVSAIASSLGQLVWGVWARPPRDFKRHGLVSPEMGLLRKRMKLPKAPVPEPHPPMRQGLASSWESFRGPTGTERDRVVDELTQWEATLPRAQQAYLRAEACATFLATFGLEVGEVWHETGMEDGEAKGLTSLTLMYEEFAAQEARRSLKDIVGVLSVQEHYFATRQFADSLIAEARKSQA